MPPPHIITSLVKTFGANCNAFSSKFAGFSICHPIYHWNTMYLATRHAIYSAALSTEATATLMFLPSWNKRMTTSPYASLYCIFLHLRQELLQCLQQELAERTRQRNS